MSVRIGGPHGGMTIEQLKYFEHVVATGGDIKPGDSDEVIQQKLAAYNTALRRLHDLNGGDGPLQYAQVPSGGYGGHYEIDPDELDGIIKEWQDIVSGLKKDEADIQFIRQVLPPAPDKPASKAQAHALSKFGERMHHRNEEMSRYASMYLQNLEETRKQYQAQEQYGRDAMHRQAEGM